MTDTTYINAMHNGLPDPVLDRQFYKRVTSKRLVAWVIDTLIIFAIAIPVGAILTVATLGLIFLVLPPLFLTLSFIYRTLTIGNRSATWGMRMMGIEFRNRDGDRFEMSTAAAHTGLYMLSVATLIGWLISVLMMVGSRYGQGLPDMLLGSTAINTPLDR